MNRTTASMTTRDARQLDDSSDPLHRPSEPGSIAVVVERAKSRSTTTRFRSAAAGTAKMKAPRRNQRKMIPARMTTQCGVTTLSQGSPDPQQQKGADHCPDGKSTLRSRPAPRFENRRSFSAPESRPRHDV